MALARAIAPLIDTHPPRIRSLFLVFTRYNTTGRSLYTYVFVYVCIYKNGIARKIDAAGGKRSRHMFRDHLSPSLLIFYSVYEFFATGYLSLSLSLSFSLSLSLYSCCINSPPSRCAPRVLRARVFCTLFVGG